MKSPPVTCSEIAETENNGRPVILVREHTIGLSTVTYWRDARRWVPTTYVIASFGGHNYSVSVSLKSFVRFLNDARPELNNKGTFVQNLQYLLPSSWVLLDEEMCRLKGLQSHPGPNGNGNSLVFYVNDSRLIKVYKVVIDRQYDVNLTECGPGALIGLY